MDYLKEAKEVFEAEIHALKETENVLGETFGMIVEAITGCEGKVIVCGIGKSGHIAGKMSATLASLGTPSFKLHPAEALHGDLGMVSKNDVVILISHSGESDEVIRLLPSLKFIGARLVGITSVVDSTLARECEIVQIMPDFQEACSLNLAPTSSTTSVMVYGDALAVTASKIYGFDRKNFALYHPAGTLGKKLLTRVKDIMATGENIPVVYSGCSICDAIMEMSRKGLGVVVILGAQEKLIGILTDGDLRRAIENHTDLYKDIVDAVMTKNPKWINAEILLVDALQRLKEKRLNNYPVVDEMHHVIGMLTWQMIVREGIIL